MAAQTEALREMVARFNERKQLDVARYFAPNFQLHQPDADVSRTGLEGAQSMIDALYALGSDVQLQILDTIEQGDLVAVRWQVVATQPAALSAAMMAFYRFVDGRIVEDWGIAARSGWRI